MKNLILRLLHIILIALVAVFGEFAPTTQTGITIAFWIAFGLAGIKLVFDCIKAIKNHNYINRYLTIAVASTLLMLNGFYTETVIALVLFLAVDLAADYIVASNKKTYSQLKKLMPKKTTVFQNGTETEISLDEISTGRIVVVNPGEMIPVDGVIFTGRSTADISFLIGKRRTVEIGKGDAVYAGSINGDGVVQIEATAPPTESIFSKMLTSTGEAMNGSDDILKKTFTLAQILSVVFIIAGALVTLIPPFALGHEYDDWIYRGMILIMAGSFDRIVDIIRISTTSLIYDLFFKGILVDRNAIGKLSVTTGILLEKSQKFAEGTYRISSIQEDACSKEEIITMAAHLEYFSNHIIAKTIVDGFIQVARYEGIVDINPVRINLVENFEEIKGKGVTGKVAGRFVCVGNKSLMDLLNIKNLPTSDDYELIYVAIDQVYSGCIVLEYLQKPGVEDVYSAWSDAGITKYAVLDGKADEIAAELRNEIGKNETMAFVGVDNHHGEGNDADLCILIDCLENKLLAQGDVQMMQGSLSEIASLRNSATDCTKKAKTKVIFASTVNAIAFTATAVAGLPLYLPVLISGLAQFFTLKTIK